MTPTERPQTPKEQALAALSVIALDVDIAGYLLKNDPQALRQVNAAIRRLQNPGEGFETDAIPVPEFGEPRVTFRIEEDETTVAVKRGVTCRFCTVDGFRWTNEGSESAPKWRLADEAGILHNCRRGAR